MSHLIHNLTILIGTRDELLKLKPIPAEMTIIQLLSSIATRLALPPAATGTLTYKGRQLGLTETLAEAGIEDGDTLVAKFEGIENGQSRGRGFPTAVNSRGEFKENQEPRCPCVLLLDVSASMRGKSIRELNDGVTILTNELRKDSVAPLRVEIAIITFGSEVEMIREFTTINKFNPPTLSAHGLTSMGRAINLALDKLEERKEVYRQNFISHYRPWVFLITDGEPNDEWQTAAQRIREFEAKKKVNFFAVGVEDANMKQLKEFTPPGRSPVKLRDTKWREMFLWLSNSLKSTSNSRPGDDVPVQSPLGEDGWAMIGT